jgi:hypothetical protein
MSSNSSNRKRRGAAEGRRPIKITPRRKKEIDPHMIGLCYFLIAQRIVREAEQDEISSRSADAKNDDRPSDTPTAASPEDRS